MVVHLNLIAFSSVFFATQLALFPDISIIACGKVPAVLGKRYAKGCEKKCGEVIKTLITFLFSSLSLWLGGCGETRGGAGPGCAGVGRSLHQPGSPVVLLDHPWFLL